LLDDSSYLVRFDDRNQALMPAAYPNHERANVEARTAARLLDFHELDLAIRH
jgi:hypothetical protein